jgi:hypothetical protein
MDLRLGKTMIWPLVSQSGEKCRSPGISRSDRLAGPGHRLIQDPVDRPAGRAACDTPDVRGPRPPESVSE